MTESRAVLPKPKKGGRPATGRDPVTAIRLSKDFRAAVDSWAGEQEDKPPRSEAIRRLVEIALAKTADRPQVLSTAKQGAARAAELAAKAIDKHFDPDAHPEEREVRKRKLIQGPSIIRDSRKDRPGK